MSRWFLAGFASLGLSFSALAGNPAPSQVFYVPFPENDQLAGYVGVNVAAVDPLAVFVSFSASADNTVIYYDHWEDGYETDVTTLKQSSTLVFGDGNPSNGYPPGNAGDLISAGTVFSLRNYVISTTLQSVLDYDARDKISSFKPISVTKTTFPASTNSLLAGCVEVFEKGIWGTEYRVPVGADMPTTSATSTLTWDADIFGYSSISIMAGVGGAIVKIDADNNPITPEQTVTLAEGETNYVAGVSVGGRVVSDKPVQVVLFTGRPTSNYQSRDTSLLPTDRWSSSYFAPVSTQSSNGTVVFLYNPNASPVTVSYDFRRNATSYTTATVSVPAGGNARVTLAPSDGATNFGAYKFYTTGATPPVFYAFCAVDAANTAVSNNQAYDGGFTLVGQPSLTTQVLVSLGIGRDPYSTTNPAENGNAVWVTTAGNGHTAETVYIDFNGDNAGSLIDPNGNKYDIAYSLRELEQRKLFDPDGDQSGMLIYSLNPNVKIAAAWVQDPSVATAGQPGLDVCTLIPPLREGDASKGSSIAIDSDGDGYRSPGDTLEYDIRTINTARSSINGPFAIRDNLPVDLTYVPDSTRYRYSVNGAWQAWVAVPDDGSGTAFPLDGSGYGVPGTLGVGQQIQAVFQAKIKTYSTLSFGATRVTNTGSVVVTPYGVTVGLEWSDLLYGSISDRVWADSNGNGVQDSGENGLNGVIIYADGNNNGTRDPREPESVTSGDGNYLLAGLLAGNYIVRVDAASLAALDPSYGPSYDIDGITTSYVANVALAAAERNTVVDFGFREGASLGDRIWVDLNGDGVQGANEPGMNGVRVFIDTNGNGTYDVGEINTITSGDGGYQIGNLSVGTQVVCVDPNTLPVGAVQTFDLDGVTTPGKASVSFVGSQHRADLDFGYRGSISIGDVVWNDANANGSRIVYNIINGRIDINNSGSADNSDDGALGTMQIIKGRVDLSGNGTIGEEDTGFLQGLSVISGAIDVNNSTTVDSSDQATGGVASEAGIANVRVFIDGNGNGNFDGNEAFATTNASGVYSISNLTNGTYFVRVDTGTLPNSMASTYDLTNPVTDSQATVVLSGASRTDVDFGYRNDASIGDRVWNDMDNDGVQDLGEPGIEGVLVYIDADGDNLFDAGVERFSTTNVSGSYSFGDLAVGTYTVRVEISTFPRGSIQTFDFDGVGSAHEASRSLTVSQDATDVDFGYQSTTSVGDIVWIDSNADGIQGSGELGINGVRVYLDMNGNGSFDISSEPSTMTANGGVYSLSGLVSGTYTARVDASTLPAGVTITYDLAGGLDNAATFMLNPAQNRTDLDFGYTQPVSIGNRVWNDLNVNGVLDSGEEGVDGVAVTLYNAASTTISGTTTSSAGGNYAFNNVLPGTYFVEFGAFAGYSRTLVDVGLDTSDSDANQATGRTENVTLTSGQSNMTLDAGYFAPVTIGDLVFNDPNANGVQDSGEVGLAGVPVSLYRQGFGPDGIAGNEDDATAVGVITSDLGGAYNFTSLRPGTYQVGFGTLAGYVRSPTDRGANDLQDSDADEATGLTGSYVVVAGQVISSIDAGYIEFGSISGTVMADTDNDMDADVPLEGVTVQLLDRVGSLVLDSNSLPIITTTLVNGTYAFKNLLPGQYSLRQVQPFNYDSVSDTDGPNDNVIGNSSIITVVSGGNSGGNDFIEIQLGEISGSVRMDTDNNGSGDAAFSGVSLNLLDGSGAPVLDGLGAPIRVVTNSSGFYRFAFVRTGNYQISQSQPAGFGSVSDVDGANNNVIGDETPIVMTPGLIVVNRDFVEISLGAISGFVRAGSNPLSGITLTLLDSFGNPVDGDLMNPGMQSVTTVTNTQGYYRFSGVLPGTYQVGQLQPLGFNSVADVDGGDINIIGDKVPIVIAPGQHRENNNFLEAIDTCPDDWAQWKFQHPGETPSGNADDDSYDNFAEFAFAMPAENGAGSPWIKSTAWTIRRSEIAPDTLEGVFVRPKGAPLNVTYTLQFAASLGNPTVWQSKLLTPLMISLKDNGDCTETVTIHDLEGLTNLQSGTGSVRIQAELDEVPATGTDHTSFSEVEGWKGTAVELCCRTYNNPYLRETIFTGRVSSVAGQVISLAVSAGNTDLSSLLALGGQFYLEVVSGENEGHRFDLSTASGNTVTLANDPNLFTADPPHNTLLDAPPLSLVNDQIAIRRHWTLNEVFPMSGFGARGNQSDADQVQIFVDGAWTIYWLYDLNDADPATRRWVNASDSSMIDRSDTVIPPGQGLFFFSRTSVTSILAYGEIRANSFIRPIDSGNNLVAGGYPVDQSANGTTGRAMNLSSGFFGSLDFKSADSIFVWKADSTLSSAGYSTFYLLNGAPVQPALVRWVRVGDASVTLRDSEILLEGNRSVFVRSKAKLEGYKVPTPWNP